MTSLYLGIDFGVLRVSQHRARARAARRARIPRPRPGRARPAATSTSRKAPSPQAMSGVSSRISPGFPAPSATDERRIFTRSRPLPKSISKKAPGKGDSPRMRLCRSGAGRAKIDARLGLVDFFGVKHALFRLRLELQPAALQRGKRPPDEIGAQRGQPVVRLAGGHVGRDRQLFRPWRWGRCRAPPPSASLRRRFPGRRP